MTIEILGSGGAVAVPRAFCTCHVCEQARVHPEPPYVRHSPSIYLHDLRLLIDTPEEIRIQLTRSGITSVKTVLYSHWHPDHTAGVRVFESNYSVHSLVNPARRSRITRVILPDRVARTFDRYHALSEKLSYLEKRGLVKVEHVRSGTPRPLGRWQVTPIDLAEEIAVAYLIEGPRRIFICMDEIFGYEPIGLGRLDLAILPCGYFVENPITGAAIIDPEHPVLQHEATFEETLEIVRTLDAERVVFSHLNHGQGLTPEDFAALEARLARDPHLPPIAFAYDMMKIGL